MNKTNVFKTLLISAAAVLTSMWATPAYAQKYSKAVETKATIAAVDTIIRKHLIERKGVVNAFVEEIWNKDNKNAELAVGIAKAYYHYYKIPNNPYWNYYSLDTLHAYKYIERAIEADPKYMPAYIRGGEMQIVDNDPERNDTAKALQWYERGIKANPAAPDCYIEYAKTLLEHRDTVNSLNKMKEINGVVPSYPANLAMARICKKVYKEWTDNDIPFAGGYAKWSAFQRNLYEQTDVQNMDSIDYFDFAFSLFENGEYDRAYDLAKGGMEKFPNNVNILKVALYSSTQGKKYDEAIALANKLFSISDTIRFHSLDYTNAATAYQKKNNLKKAAEMYHKAYDIWAENLKNNVPGTKFGEGNQYMRTIINMYADAGLYEDAIAENKKWIEMAKADNKLSVVHYNSLAKLYSDFALESFGEEKTKLFMAADSAFEQVGIISEENRMYSYYQRWKLAVSELDSVTGNNNGYLMATKIENTFEKFGEEDKFDAANMSIYQAACDYLRSYYIQTGTKGKNYCASAIAKCKSYCHKILAINPEDSKSKKLLEIFNKMKNLVRC